MLKECFPPAAMIFEIRKIEDVATPQKWLDAGRMSRDKLLQDLNKLLKYPGYLVVINA
jgi:hypothetical protein